MRTDLFWISYAAAWALLLTLSGGLLILFRFSVRVYRIQASTDAGGIGSMGGPALDANPPLLELVDLRGDPVSVGRPTGAAQLIVFANNTCPRCKVALALLRSFAPDHLPAETIVVCGGNRAAIEDCAALVTSPLIAVADAEWTGAKKWRVSSMPFGVVLDATGTVRARGDPTSAAVLTVLSRYLGSRGDGAAANVNGTMSGIADHDRDLRSIRL